MKHHQYKPGEQVFDNHHEFGRVGGPMLPGQKVHAKVHGLSPAQFGAMKAKGGGGLPAPPRGGGKRIPLPRIGPKQKIKAPAKLSAPPSAAQKKVMGKKLPKTKAPPMKKVAKTPKVAKPTAHKAHAPHMPHAKASHIVGHLGSAMKHVAKAVVAGSGTEGATQSLAPKKH